MKLVLDTSFLLELRKGNETAAEILRDEKKEATDISISVLTLYELLIGSEYLWLKRRDLSERIWVEKLLKWVSIIKLNEQIVKRASKVRARAMLEGKMFPDLDLLIALSSEVPAKLITADDDHLEMKEYLEKEGIEVIFLG